MAVPFALILSFACVVLLALSIAEMIFNASDRNRQVNRRLTLLAANVSPDKVYSTLVRKSPTDALSTVAPGLYERAALYCRQAGLSVGPQRVALMGLLAAVGVWVCALIFLSFTSRQDPLVNATTSFIGSLALTLMVGFIWISLRRQKRLRLVEEQLPLALDIVIRSLRAGHPVIMAVKLASSEMGDPIGSELGLVVDETNYGVEFRAALANLARRTGSEYLHFFAISVAIQSETGGNLAEILGNLNATIRAQQSLHLRVKALASEGRMSAWVLSLIPLGLVSMVMLMSPGYYTSRMDDPIFWPTVGVIGLIYAFGQFVIYRIVNFKY